MIAHLLISTAGVYSDTPEMSSSEQISIFCFPTKRRKKLTAFNTPTQMQQGLLFLGLRNRTSLCYYAEQENERSKLTVQREK